MGKFRWAIFGTGSVSHKFANGVLTDSSMTVGYVASRRIDRAKSFVVSCRPAVAVEGYDPASFPDKPDAVYIATPAALHVEHAICCLENGIPTIIEKPFATSLAGAKRIVDAARANDVFCMEAMWTRFVPAVLEAKRLIESGAIGRVHLLTGGFAQSYNEADKRHSDPESGGALLYFGVYPLSLGNFFAGRAAEVSCSWNRGNSVETTAITSIKYESGVLGNFYASLQVNGDDSFAIYGDAGVLRFSPLYRPSVLKLETWTPRSSIDRSWNAGDRIKDGSLAHKINHFLSVLSPLKSIIRTRSIRRPYTGNGYYHEAAEARTLILSARTESQTMPLGDSLEIMSLVDRVRRSAEGKSR